MDIGILEFFYHHIFLYSLALIAHKSGCNVTIFTTKNIYRLVEPLLGTRVKNFNWIIKGNNESLVHFLKRVQIYSNSLDLIFVNTLQGAIRSPSYLLFKPYCRAILVMGRVREWFEPKFQWILLNNFWNQSFRPIIPYIIAQKILSIYDAVVVHTIPIKNYLEAHGYNKPIFILPFSIFENNNASIPDCNLTNFLVSGSIEECRRDYLGMLDVFYQIWTEGYNNFNLTLLGRPERRYGRAVIKRVNYYEKLGFKIEFFGKYIPEEIYKQKVEESHILINPVKQDMYYKGMFMSGLVEVIRHAKPGIYPSHYYVPPEFKTSSLFYKDYSEMKNIIIKCLNLKHIKHLIKNAQVNSKRFSLEQVSKYFKEEIIN